MPTPARPSRKVPHKTTGDGTLDPGHLCDHSMTEGATHICVCPRTLDHVALHLIPIDRPFDQPALFEL